MADQWHLLRDGNRYGPYTGTDLKTHAGTGHLLPGDLLVRDGTANPVPASKLRGLFPTQQSSAKPPRLNSSDDFGTAAEDSSPISRRPTATPSRKKSLVVLGGCCLTLVAIAMAFFAATSGRRATVAKGPDAAGTGGDRKVQKYEVSEGRKAKTVPDVKVDLPDFTKVDYSLDTSKLDYSKGPQKQVLVRSKALTKNSGRGDVVVEWLGYKDETSEMVQQGLNTVFHDNREKAEESFYFAGKKHGTVKTWYESGEKESSGLMKGHVKHGKWQLWHKNGKLKQEAYRLAGKQHGNYTTWFASGQKKFETTFVNHERRGLSRSWWPNGTKGSEVGFKSDVRHGPAAWWDVRGELLLRLQYRDGRTSYDPANGTVEEFKIAKQSIFEELGRDREKMDLFFEIFNRPQSGFAQLPDNKY